MKSTISRRQMLLGTGGILLGGLATADRFGLIDIDVIRPMLRAGETFNMFAQRIALHDRPLAPEYRPDQISASFPQNGGFGKSYIEPDPYYDHLLTTGFSDWRLSIEGLVDRPMSLNIEQIRAMPERTQITMHSCDSGWSAIGQWSGVQLGYILNLAGIQDRARYIYFQCMDKISADSKQEKIIGKNIYGSIDLLDAYHPQTILAHSMNGKPLPKEHGAPLRLRLELQLGYKNLKHINRIVVTESLNDFGDGSGGIFEEVGYQWYAGL